MQNEKLKVDIDKRTYKFALKVVRFVQKLPRNMVAMELGRQLLRSATSIAANVEEAQGGFSKEDFTYKMNTAFKEAKETDLWLRLMNDAKIASIELRVDNEELRKESYELKNILAKIVQTSKKK